MSAMACRRSRPLWKLFTKSTASYQRTFCTSHAPPESLLAVKPSSIESAGHGLFVRRPVPQSAVLLTEEPFATAPYTKNVNAHNVQPGAASIVPSEVACHTCLRVIGESDAECPACHSRFCSPSCRETANRRVYGVFCSPEHEGPCELSTLMEYCSLNQRIVPLVVSNILSRCVTAGPAFLDEFNKVGRLKHAIEEDNANLKQEFEFVRDILKTKIKGVDRMFNYDVYKLLVGTLKLNSFRVEVASHPFARQYGDDSLPVGTALFAELSFANHSCDPNCSVQFPSSSTVELVALRDMVEGEEVTVSYIDKNARYQVRREQLAPYGFLCTCNKCTTEREL